MVQNLLELQEDSKNLRRKVQEVVGKSQVVIFFSYLICGVTVFLVPGIPGSPLSPLGPDCPGLPGSPKVGSSL